MKLDDSKIEVLLDRARREVDEGLLPGCQVALAIDGEVEVFESYGDAKPDGLSIAVVNAALYFDQLLKRDEVKFDWAKFAWIGSTTPSDSLLYMWAAAPYKTIQDVRSATTPPNSTRQMPQTFTSRIAVMSLVQRLMIRPSLVLS